MPKAKSLFMEHTEVAPEKTAGEICTVLIHAGATQINQQYDNGKVVGLRWLMKVNGIEACFAMPVRIKPVYDLLRSRRAIQYEQAERVAWRQLLRWCQAQMAIIETGIVKPGEVFSPYLEVAPGKTMWDMLTETRFKLLEAPADDAQGAA